jgi:hypothetical protein
VGWLRTRVLAALAANATSPAPRPALVLVRRSAPHTVSAQGSRGWDRGRATRDEAVLNVARRHASEHGLDLLMHGDDQLPPLWHQLRAFSAAAIVVAPMGAAQVSQAESPHAPRSAVAPAANWRVRIVAPMVCGVKSRGGAFWSPHSGFKIGHPVRPSVHTPCTCPRMIEWRMRLGAPHAPCARKSAVRLSLSRLQVNLLASPRSACLVESQPLRSPDVGTAFISTAQEDGTTRTNVEKARLAGGSTDRVAGASTRTSGRSPAHAAFDETYAELCSILGIRYVLTPTTPQWALPPAALADALGTACDRRNPATLRHPTQVATAPHEELTQPRSRRRLIPSRLLTRQGWVSWEG